MAQVELKASTEQDGPPQECSLGNPLGSESPKKCFNTKDSGNGSAEAVAVLVERGFCQIVAW